MANQRDKPPILRVLVLLVALVSAALALAALSPSQPETTAGAKSGATASPTSPP